MKKSLKKKELTSKKADAIFSKFIRDRDKTCFFCSNVASQCSHFWGRGNSSTRYNPLNCDGICGGCHMRHEGNKQGLYRDKKIEQLGLQGYIELEKLGRSVMKRSQAIEQLIKYLGLEGY